MRVFLSLILLAVGPAAHAAIVTIDFEGLPDTGFINPGAIPVFAEGFSFTTPSGSQGITTWPPGVADGQVFHWCGQGPFCGTSDEMTMTQLGPEGFDVISLDMAAATAGGSTENILVTGFYAGGGSIQTTLAVASADFVTFNLGAGWTGLSSLVLDTQTELSIAVGVDNIVVNVVPVPAAVWLFGSALLGLGWLRRSSRV